MDTAHSDMIEIFQNELSNSPSLDVEELVPPYDNNLSFDEQFKIAHKELQKSIRHKDRVTSLINAYFLGKLLSSQPTTTKRFQYKRKLTTHYAVMAEYTYDIFEFNVIKVFSMTTLSVQQIKKLKRSQVLHLRKIVGNINIFDGAQT
jgi:hypothetical protein